MSSSRLSGRLSIVTGSARGLGAGVATRLAAEGSTVVCADLAPAETTVETIRAAGGEASHVELDVTDSAHVEDVFARIVAVHGPIHALVNNAGVAQPVQRLIDTSDAQLQQVFAVNVFGVLACSRAAAHLMIEAGRGGRIVNMASQVAKAPWPGWGAYCASKACVINITQSLALELAEHAITVNAVCPGTMLTDMTRVGFSFGLQQGQTLEAALAEKAASIPLKRLGTPEDVGAMVAWLISDDASYTTGASLNLTGGETVAF
ncbi:MAG TPA: SDR family NAD(P)-dependent oxidoreductase [Acidimicrobiales bacterium]|nr:SDR family NAD(P)-dependent oxidoreductase [Acidimicrobiales bacterium]